MKHYKMENKTVNEPKPVYTAQSNKLIINISKLKIPIMLLIFCDGGNFNLQHFITKHKFIRLN